MRRLFAFDECLDCGWKSSSHQGKHFSPFAVGCLVVLVIALLSPVFVHLFKLIYLIYFVVALLLAGAIFFLINGIFLHHHHHPPQHCLSCGSNHIRHHHGLWD